MPELMTSPTGASVRAFLDGIEGEGRRRDAKAVTRVMRRVTGEDLVARSVERPRAKHSPRA